MSEFIIGIIVTLASSVVTYIFKENIEAFLNLVFRNIFPKVGGKWKFYTYNDVTEDPIFEMDEVELIEFLEKEGESEKVIKEVLEEKKEYDKEKIPKSLRNVELVEHLKEPNFYMQAELKQLANRIKGSIKSYEDGKIVRTLEVKGRITPTRIIILSTEDKTDGHHNFGTILVKLSPDSKFMQGYETFLCSSCEDTAYEHVLMEKQE